MKRLKVVLVSAVAAMVLTGCLYTHVLTPLDMNVDKTTMGQKRGTSTMYSVLGLFAWGDSSTSAAAKNGGITTVNHMDHEAFNIFFGAYTESTTIVYGD